MKILVCGGRDYQDRGRVFTVLDDLHLGTGPAGGPTGTQRLLACLITGAARGADLLAEEWARIRQVPYRGDPAQWEKHGRSAGPRRNALMLATEHHPAHPIGLVIAFPGNEGTADMVRRARAAHIDVMEISP